MVWPAIIAAGAALVGGAMQADNNADEARRNRNFQAEMSNTSYQRAMADLKAAGLNPILAANQGASTPTGATGSMDNPNLGEAVRTGIQAASAKQSIEQSKAEEGLLKEKQQTERDQQHYLRHQSEQSATQAELNKTTDRLTNARAIKEERLSPAYTLMGDAIDSGIDFVKSSAKEHADFSIPDVTDRAKNAIERKMDEWRKDYENRRKKK